MNGQHKLALTVPRDATVGQLRETALACYQAFKEDHLVPSPPPRLAPGEKRKPGPRPKEKATALGVLSGPVVGTLRQLDFESLQLGRRDCWKGK